MPLRLNLLSGEKIQYLKKLVRIQFVKEILEIVLACVCVLGIALIGGQKLLQDHFNSLAEQIVAVNKQYSNSNREIKDINSLLARTESIQREYKTLSPQLIELTTAIPEPIRLSDFNFDMRTRKITLTGEAPRREDLLALEQSLHNIAWIDIVDVPLSQLTARENLNFSISVTITNKSN